jgi:hypothetical protein
LTELGGWPVAESERQVSGIVLAGVLDYYSKVWGKVAAGELTKAMGVQDVYIGSWYPIGHLEMVLTRIWADSPKRVRMAGEHTSKLIGDERRYERKFYTPEQMLQETRQAWDLSFNTGSPDVELVPGKTTITVPRAPFKEAYWQDFLEGGIKGMLSLSKAIESEIEIDATVDERIDRYVYVFRAKKLARGEPAR